jgi:hypothetical protein
MAQPTIVAKLSVFLKSFKIVNIMEKRDPLELLERHFPADAAVNSHLRFKILFTEASVSRLRR